VRALPSVIQQACLSVLWNHAIVLLHAPR